MAEVDYLHMPLPSDDDTPELLELAAAVADSDAVDWSKVEAGSSPETSSVIRQLKALASMVALHRTAPASVPIADRLVAGDRWGALEVRREVGRGSFATVCLAWDPGLEREVALKLLHVHGDLAPVDAVMQEGRLLARVSHPNVVRIYGIDEHDGRVGLEMEFVDGLTLKAVLGERGVFGAAEAALIGFDLCGAVAAVHRAGLIHRDIKTQNVMRAVGGRIVLMDFGGVGNLSDRESYVRNMKGTPLYLAPEIFDGGSASIASDVYSLGVLLFNLVTQRFPVEGHSLEEIEAKHARNEQLSLGDLRPDLPDAFVQVICRALERDPARRFRSAGAMQDALIRSMNLGMPAESFALAPSTNRDLPSIAVLPFANVGPDPDLEYFSEGLAEELVTAFGKVRGLRVVSRTAALRFRGHQTDLQTLCRELDATTVLEGTVSKSGGQLRVSARLVNGADGFLLWSERYSRTMDDVFAVQDDIATQVVERFRLSAGAIQQLVLGARHTDNPRAYHLYLKGRFNWSRRYHGGLATAIDCFSRAIAEDAGYSLAHAGLADVYAFLGLYSLMKPSDAFTMASSAAYRAMQIDPDVPEVQTSLGLVATGRDWDMPRAMRHLTRAVELDRGQALPRIYHAWIHVILGNFPEAVRLAREAQAIDDTSPLVNSGAGYAYFMAGRFDDGAAECDRALETQPNFIIGLYVKGMCRAVQGRLDEAIDLLSRAAAMSNRAPFYLGLLGNFFATAGRVDEAHAILDELQSRVADSYVPPHAFTFIYTALGDLERAFEWQDRANEDGASPFNYFSPVIQPLQDHPRHLEDLRQRGWMAWSDR
ncbi:MAG: protein kinase [Vicinamibacterales bacterium]